MFVHPDWFDCYIQNFKILSYNVTKITIRLLAILSVSGMLAEWLKRETPTVGSLVQSPGLAVSFEYCFILVTMFGIHRHCSFTFRDNFQNQ